VSTENPYEAADQLVARLEAARGRVIADEVRAILSEGIERHGWGFVEYTRQARALVEHFTQPPEPAPPRRVPVDLPPGWQPDAEQDDTPATRRRAVGMAPDVRRAMPELAHRLYLYAEARADRHGRFTCTRPQAMRALLVSDGAVGNMIRLHVAAGVWKRDKPGGWRTRGRSRPRQTVYQFVDDFDRTSAIRAYQQWRRARRQVLQVLEERRQAKGPGEAVDAVS
jgi:hypothetical protein